MDFFTKASTWLADSVGVGSIDWAALAKQGVPGVHNSAYINQYMAPAFGQAAVVMSTLDLQPGTTADVLSDYYQVQSKLGTTADNMLKAVGTSIQVNTPLIMPTLVWSEVNNILYYMWAVSFVGMQAHLTGAIQRSGLTDAEISRNASILTMTFSLLVKLDAMGVLKPFKKDAAAGLGIAPALLAAIIVLGTVLLIALAWGTVAIYESSRINARVDAACNRALQTGNAQDQAMCQQMQASSSQLANTVPNAVSGVIEKISIMAMVGAGIWIAVQFGPSIATKIKQSVASWKAA